jgi:hypothetical protein
VGEASEKPQLGPEDAKVLPAREALSLISGRLSEAEEDVSGGGEQPLAAEDGSSGPIDRT